MIKIQRVKNIADEHIFSTIAISLSLIFAIIPSTICFATFWLETKFYGLLFFIPTLALILICYLINLSNTKIIKIIPTLNITSERIPNNTFINITYFLNIKNS